MLITRVPVEVSGRRIMDTQKIAIYVEANPQGEIFVKTEAQNGPYVSMINFNYDPEKAMKEFEILTRQFLQEQIENLRKVAETIGD